MCSPKQWLLRNFLNIFWSPVFFWPTKHLIPFPIVFQIWHFHCRHIIQPRRGFVTTQEFFELPPNKFTASRATPSSPQYKIQRKRRISIQTKKSVERQISLVVNHQTDEKRLKESSSSTNINKIHSAMVWISGSTWVVDDAENMETKMLINDSKTRENVQNDWDDCLCRIASAFSSIYCTCTCTC